MKKKQTKEFFAQKLIKLFPEKERALMLHYQDYNNLHGHIFFADEISISLFELLSINKTADEIKKYCAFIEDMWLNGKDDVVNVVDVTILEKLSDDEIVWNNFGKYISNEFIRYINTDLLINNLMMSGVKRLEYNK